MNTAFLEIVILNWLACQIVMWVKRANQGAEQCHNVWLNTLLDALKSLLLYWAQMLKSIHNLLVNRAQTYTVCSTAWGILGEQLLRLHYMGNTFCSMWICMDSHLYKGCGNHVTSEETGWTVYTITMQKELLLVLSSAAAQQPPAAMFKTDKVKRKIKFIDPTGTAHSLGNYKNFNTIVSKCPEFYQSQLTQTFFLSTLDPIYWSSPVTCLCAGGTPDARVTLNTVYDCWCYTVHSVCDVCGRVTPDTVKTLLEWWIGKML